MSWLTFFANLRWWHLEVWSSNVGMSTGGDSGLKTEGMMGQPAETGGSLNPLVCVKIAKLVQGLNSLS